MNQEAKATSRKARGIHNLVDTGINGDADTDAERRLTWFRYLTQRPLCGLLIKGKVRCKASP
jgi:hypothetical protein